MSGINSDDVKPKEIKFDPNVKIGGEERILIPYEDEDGNPVFYTVKIVSWTPRQGKTDDEGNPSIFLSWEFEIIEPEIFAGNKLWGATNSEARRSYKDGKPLKLLQLILAINKGIEPESGKTIDLSKTIGREIKVRIENNERGDKTYQNAVEFKPIKKVVKKDDVPGLGADDIKEKVNNEDDVTDEEIESLMSE